MFLRGVLLSLVLAVAPGAVAAQEAQKKDSAPDNSPQGQKNKALADNEAEVLFANGSRVRMTIVQDAFEVTTKYGKLNVPLKEIRRLEFGIHLPEGAQEKIDAAIKKLGSPMFKERDAGVNELVAIGFHAYPTLVSLYKNPPSPEVAQRATVAIQRIRAKTPENMLRLRQEDIIVTPTFTVVGRITSPTLKAKAEYFGDLQVQIAGVRNIRWLRGGSGDTEFTVDAAKYASQQIAWMETDFYVDGISKLTIEASGQVDLWPQGPGQYMSKAEGYQQGGKRGQFWAGTLVGKIGENGEPFAIGSRYVGNPNREGKLYVHIVPSPWQNESMGSYQVRVSANFVGRGQ